MRPWGSTPFPPQHRTVDNAHGRIEWREIWTSPAGNSYLEFPHVGQVFCIRRTTTDLHGGGVKGRQSLTETVYGLTSLTPPHADPARLLQLNRGHWSIENTSHGVRDMAYDEDRQQIRRRNGPRVMATLRNVAIGLLRLAGYHGIAAALRVLAAHRRRVFHLLGLHGCVGATSPQTRHRATPTSARR